MSYEFQLLQLSSASGIGNKKLYKLISRLRAENRSLEDFLASPSKELKDIYNLSSITIDSLSESYETSELLFELLRENEIRMLVRGEGNYPVILEARLGDDSPTILFAKGNLDILDMKSVSVSGSRNVSEFGFNYSYEASKIMAKDDINVISGYAKGVDLQAHSSALINGGVTTLILAEGILKYQQKANFKEYLSEDNYLILSEFPPNLPWVTHSAMKRNSTICGISSSLLVIESASSGGTLAAGEMALKMNTPLYVIDPQGHSEIPEGNRILINMGGQSLGIDMDGIPLMDPLLEQVKNFDITNVDLDSQIKLKFQA